MLGDRPSAATIQCSDSDGGRQLLHVQAVCERIAAARDGCARLLLSAYEAMQVMGGVAAHVAWVSTTSRGRQPHCVQVTATGPGGSAERAFIKSGGQHILALCEGGIFPQFDTQAARKALAGHTRQLMARRARDDN